MIFFEEISEEAIIHQNFDAFCLSYQSSKYKNIDQIEIGKLLFIRSITY